MEKFMDRIRQCMADSEYGSKSIGSHPKMCMFAKKFFCMIFWLDRIGFGVRISIDLYFICLNFNRLTASACFYQYPSCTNCGARMQSLFDFIVGAVPVDYHLTVVECASIVESDNLVVAQRRRPSVDGDC